MNNRPSSNSIQIPDLGDRTDGWVPRDISQTPGGTFLAVTPGGTSIRWSREQMMHLANSPLSRSPITLPPIPGVTVGVLLEDDEPIFVPSLEPLPPDDDGPLFPMDQ